MRPRIVEAVHHDERRVLVVENSSSVAQAVSMYISERCGRLTRIAHTLAEAKTRLAAEAADGWLAAVVNLELPDATGEEIVSLTLEHGVPTVVLTGTFNDAMRKRILKHDIVDYCLKGKAGTEQLLRTIDRISRAPHIKVLVVDESEPSRTRQREMLASHRLHVLTAADADEALAMHGEHPDLALVIVDQTLPKRDGLELVAELRELARQDDLAILGLSSRDASGASVRFLKAGASDFLAKPFEKEEYLCRVWASIEVIENMREIKRAAFVDALTGTANRLAFFRRVPALMSEALRERAKPSIALLSIDQLRELNESHGHAAGDAVLTGAAREIADHLGKQTMLARFSGEQFCVFVPDVPPGNLEKLFERVCSAVERASFNHEGRTLRATLSCGVSVCESDESLDALINRAADALDKAESAGGNRAVVVP